MHLHVNIYLTVNQASATDKVSKKHRLYRPFCKRYLPFTYNLWAKQSIASEQL